MRLLIIVLGVICAVCALPRQTRIGGEPTTIENYPFVAGLLIEYGSTYRLMCGGTLISPTSVLSAAHCFMKTPPYQVRVRLGTDKDTSGGTEHIVSRIIIHPRYDDLLYLNDILIMRLRDAAVYSERINSARIPGPQYVPPTNTVVYAVGWGDDIQEGESSSEILRHVPVNVIDHQICTERHAYLKTLPGMDEWPDVTPEMLCTGLLDVGGKDACQRHSGGPVIHNRDVIVGISSLVYECGHPLYPAINVRVSNYTDWIYTNSVN